MLINYLEYRSADSLCRSLAGLWFRPAPRKTFLEWHTLAGKLKNITSNEIVAHIIFLHLYLVLNINRVFYA